MQKRGGRRVDMYKYEYEISEKLFEDIWEKYGMPEEIEEPEAIYNILSDLVEASKQSIALDHYSKINFDNVIRIEYDRNESFFKIYWLDNDEFRLAKLRNELSEEQGLIWYNCGYCTYEYLAIDIEKLKFVKINSHIFILIKAKLIKEKELKRKLIGTNEMICINRCTDQLYTEYIFWEGDKAELKKVECIVSNLPYYVCVIQPKEKIPSTYFSKRLLLAYTLDEISLRLERVWESLNEKKLDSDELFSKGNTIRTIMEYALKYFCVVEKIPMNIESNYGNIMLGDLRKKIGSIGVNISQGLVNMANEVSHDSGKQYNIEDIKKFWRQAKGVIDEIQIIIEEQAAKYTI